MWARLRLLPWLLVGLAAAALLGGQLLLQRHIRTGDFQDFARARLEEYLDARVEIGKIRLRFLNRIVLTQLEISPRSEDPAYKLQIQRVLFEYSFWQLITRDFKIPASVTFDAPQMVLPAISVLPSLMGEDDHALAPSGVYDVKLSGGKIQLPIRGFSGKLTLKNIRGGLVSAGKGKRSVRFEAAFSDFLEGHASLTGQIDLNERQFNLEFILRDLRLNRESPLALRDVQGVIRIENHKIEIQELRGKVHDWDLFLSGKVLEPFGLSLLKARLELRKAEPFLNTDFEVNLSDQSLRGQLRLFPKGEIPFEGRISRQGIRWWIEDLKIGDQYRGYGKLDLSSGEYRLYAESQKQRLTLDSNLKGESLRFGVHLDHVPFWGLDLVTAFHVVLRPKETRWEDQPWRFSGAFSTDYFLLEYEPFRDFRGTFDISPAGLHDFKSEWGGMFDMVGEILLQDEQPTGNATLRVHDFDLSRIQEFATKPLPQGIRGILEGKMKIEGDFRKPEVAGNFSIKNGSMGRLQYDRAMIHFKGFPPYLPLQESKILKGRTTLYMNGAIDMSLSNPFYGVRVQTDDKLILWKGLVLNTSQEAGDIEIAGPVPHGPSLRVMVGDMNDSDTAAAVMQEENKVAGVGPKIEF